MAKNKTAKNKANKQNPGKGAGKNQAKKAEKAERKSAPEVLAAEAAYKAGNYAELAKLAAADGDLPADARARIDTLHEMTKTDPQAWMVGAGAFVIAVIVAVATLGS